jgi:hypothetical protein
MVISVFIMGCSTLGPSAASTPPAAPAVQPAQPAAQPAPKKEKIITLKIPRVIKESYLFEDGTLDEFRVYSYSEDGKLLLKEELYDADSGDLLESIQYGYKDGLATERKSFDRENKLKGKKTFSYTPAGLPETENFFDRNEKLQAVMKYFHDAAGNRTELQTVDSAGVLLAATRYEYSGGRPGKIVLLGPGGKLDAAITISYDGKGGKTREVFADGAGKTEKEIVYSYDDKDRPSSETTLNANKAVTGKIAYEYPPVGDGPVKIRYLDGREKTKKITLQEFAFREEKKVIYE